MPRVIHFEIPVDDPVRARAFYADVFGWTLAGEGDVPYWLATTGDGSDVGIDGALTARSEVHAMPVLVVEVPELDDAVARATGAGAVLVHDRHDVPGAGSSAYVRDPEGNVIGLWQSA